MVRLHLTGDGWHVDNIEDDLPVDFYNDGHEGTVVWAVYSYYQDNYRIFDELFDEIKSDIIKPHVVSCTLDNDFLALEIDLRSEEDDDVSS